MKHLIHSNHNIHWISYHISHLAFALIDIFMGICSNEQLGGKRSASENLQLIFPSDGKQRSPILFQIKEWPDRHSVDLRNPQEAFSRTMEFSLLPGERIDITLKTRQQEAGGNESSAVGRVSSGDGLHCILRRTNQYYQLDFPIQEGREAVWKYTCGWMIFNVGDTVRMGNSRHTLRKLIINDNRELEELRQSLHRTASLSESAARCRICLSSAEQPENPLISPCKCQGSVRLVHLRCLAAWLFSSTLTQGHFLTVRTNKTVCELCKTDLTNTAEFIRMENLLLTNLNEVPPPYAIFQSCGQEENPAKNYLVLSFKIKQVYSFGRTTFDNRHQSADITEGDIHMSRLNTELKYSNGGLYFRDCESLHGSLLKTSQPIRLSKANNVERLTFHNMLFQVSYEPAAQEKGMEVLPQANQQASIKIL